MLQKCRVYIFNQSKWVLESALCNKKWPCFFYAFWLEFGSIYPALYLYFMHICGLVILWQLSHPLGHRTPPARSGHRCVADNANLYVFGGYNPDYDESGGPENEDYPLFRELWRYHFATGCWQQIRTDGYMPTELASMSGKTLYIPFLPLLSNCLSLVFHFEVEHMSVLWVFFFSCFTWQQPPGVWRNWDPLWWK